MMLNLQTVCYYRLLFLQKYSYFNSVKIASPGIKPGFAMTLGVYKLAFNTVSEHTG
jgi:hypothetical protein